MNRLTTAFLILHLGCAPDGEEDQAERAGPPSVEAVVEAWTRSPTDGAVALAALPTPEEQLLAVRALLDRGQVQDASVCAYLTDAGTRSYCRELAMRPHLFEDARPQQAARTRTAGGPADSELLPTVAIESPASGAPPLAPVDCAPTASIASCAHAGALAAADRGALDEIAGRCNAIDAPKLRAECRFAAAERALQRRFVQAIPTAVPLCLAADDFVPHCLAHGVSALAARAPSATAADEAWDPLRSAVAALHTAFAPLDPALGADVEQRLWAEATAVAFRRAPHLDGSLLDRLPPVAAGGVRDSLAYELVSRGEIAPQSSLGEAVATLAAAERLRGPVAAARPTPVPPPIVRSRYHAPDSEGACYPTAYWRGAALRAVDPDPDLDRTLALIEAFTAVRGPADPVAREAVRHPARVVAWSAARLTNQPGSAGPRPGGGACR